MTSKRIGSQCVWLYQGKEWPVVLCDDDTPPKAFTDSRRVNEIPAILLGKRNIWVIDDGLLKTCDPHRNYLEGLPRFDSNDILASDDPETKLEKYRRIAFERDAMEWQTPEWWKHIIEQQRQAREMERQIAAKSKRKRSRRDNDDDVEIISVRTSTSGSASSSPSKRRSDSGSGTGTDRSKGAKGSQLPTPGPTPVKQKHGASRIKGGGIEDEGYDDSLFVEEAPTQSDRYTSYDAAKLQRLREQQRHSDINMPPRDDICTIFVGDARTPFQVPMKAVAKCDFFSEQVQFTEQRGSHIDLSASTSVTARDFVPVHEYMHNGDFVPCLTGRTRDSPPRIKGLVIPEQRDKVAEQCAYIFRTASQLQFASLQSLAVEKLKALYPLSPIRILIVTRIAQDSFPWGCDAEGELFAWLADHISEYFYKLMAENGHLLVRVLRHSDDLNQTVMNRVAENPKACSKGVDDD
ncbi:hypothetical protein LTR85_003165 [Meristemomyces frigidus]|nr:hypothetical protein LTR85_003165 [Meristemomyces frigidus]